MKIKSTVERVTELGTAVPIEQCVFKVPGGTGIPLGAMVTVEWDDSMHQCEELWKCGAYRLQRKGASWWLGDAASTGPWFMIVNYCPGCGKEMSVLREGV